MAIDRKAEALKLLNEYYSNRDVLSEEEVDNIFQRLSEMSPDPAISDYVFFPDGPEMTPEEIINKAFSYKPVIM
ncbi:MAG: hypothetical protein IH622_07900 [Ochrobactrum anthropi]|uniref:Bacteriocin immunity protein n=1 Tax=Brucella anthropi TaxID=529 RepID=A0A8I0T8N5_BRUAN|nr:hypothetical protein [Brucella anthropi]MBE0560729.1 hypothetical protein [Brucella anthropi]